MIISKAYAKKLQSAGKATIEDCCVEKGDGFWRMVTRHDLQRVDHFYDRAH